MRVRRLVFLGLLTAAALTIFLVEAQIPLPIPVAGVKLGLANVVTLFALCLLGPWDALAVLLLRCVLLIVGDNAELAVIAYKAIQEYLTREDITLPAREK